MSNNDPRQAEALQQLMAILSSLQQQQQQQPVAPEPPRMDPLAALLRGQMQGVPEQAPAQQNAPVDAIQALLQLSHSMQPSVPQAPQPDVQPQPLNNLLASLLGRTQVQQPQPPQQPADPISQLLRGLQPQQQPQQPVNQNHQLLSALLQQLIPQQQQPAQQPPTLASMLASQPADPSGLPSSLFLPPMRQPLIPTQYSSAPTQPSGVASMPSAAGVASMPSAPGVASMPSASGVASMPSVSGVASMPSAPDSPDAIKRNLGKAHKAAIAALAADKGKKTGKSDKTGDKKATGRDKNNSNRRRGPIDLSVIDYISPSFATRLYRTVAEAEANGHHDIVHFTEEGDGFVLVDRDRFAEELAPKHFRLRTFLSFRRQLAQYGFEKKYGAGDSLEFRHEFFHRDRPTDLCHIQRRGANAGVYPY